MSIYDSSVWIDDIHRILAQFPEMHRLAGKNILITGSTGLICSAIIDVMICWNLCHDKKINIIATGRNLTKLSQRFHPFDREKWFDIVEYDPSFMALDLRKPCDYIIHGASNASPDKILREPVETMLCNFTGMNALLDYAKSQSVRRVLLISSSEVYGRKSDNLAYRHDEYGYIDLLNPRNSYSVSKRAAETLCAAYHAEYSVDSVIVRPGHIYGPTASPDDRRVSSAWVYDAAAGRDIVMKSDGAQLRSYCHCLDAASAILKALLDGETAQAYNISNPDSVISIRELAEILAGITGVTVKREIPSEKEARQFNPMVNSSLDGTELMKLGWRGLFDAKTGFAHTIEVLKDRCNRGRELDRVFIDLPV